MGRTASDRAQIRQKTAWMCSTLPVGTTSRPPKWIKPQLTRLVDGAPAGHGWVHEIKYDGYRRKVERSGD